MVTKAIERAQNTVEQRNAEIRKNVLKYDEVMNEQRKVIYRRRQQILDGEPLGEEAVLAIESALSRLVEQYCLGEYFEDWDVPGLLDAARLYYPTRITKEHIDEVIGREALETMFVEDAKELYAEKADLIGEETLRDIERRVMLSVIDQHWREHLYEMDYLQEGINLRAMGQQDPLAEWQREGFDMFEAMMGQIEDDFVRYVFHLQVVVDEQPEQRVRNVQYSAPEDPAQGTAGFNAAAVAQAQEDPGFGESMLEPEFEEVQQPVRVEKTPGRNEPCYCGSGKKYKLCHGRA
jgi:preprotein translocase subunit SecA